MDDYLKNKKYLNYIICVIIIVFTVTIFILIFLNNKKGLSDEYLIVGNNVVWKKVNNVLYQIDPSKEKLQGEFIVNNGFDKIKSTKVKFKDDYFEFYSGNNVLDVDNFRIAYRGFSKIKIPNYSIESYDSNDEYYILDVPNTESEEDYDIYRNSLKKVSLGDNLTLYTMSDYAFGNGYRTPYSYMFLVKSNEIVDKFFEIDTDVYSIVDVLDIEGDGILDIVVSKGVSPNYYDICYQIYNIKNESLRLKQDCKNYNEKNN